MQCQAPDLEMLLFEWLNALVYQMATRRMLFSQVRRPHRGRPARGRGPRRAVDVLRHAPAVEVKGATMTELAVRQGPDGAWTAQCVVDV